MFFADYFANSIADCPTCGPGQPMTSLPVWPRPLAKPVNDSIAGKTHDHLPRQYVACF